MKHVMVDLETMSTHPSNALVLSAAVVPFRLDTDDPFSDGDCATIVVPDIGDQIMAGREVLPETQAWWRKQSVDASDHWRRPGQNRFNDVRDALSVLSSALKEADCIWSRGIVFDIGNLDSLYRSFFLPVPWRYSAPRDVRTVTEFCPRLRIAPPKAQHDLIPHNPIHDCILQVWSVWERWPIEGAVWKDKLA